MKTTKYVRLLVVGFALSGWWVSPSAFGVLNTITNFYEFFDTNLVGSVPSGWGAGGGGFALVTNDIFQSSPNSLLLVNNNGGTSAHAFKSLSPTISSNFNERVFWSYRLSLGQTDATINTFLDDGLGFFPMRVSFNNDGNIRASSNTTAVILAPYTADTWYEVRVAFTPIAHSYDIEILTNDTVFVSRTALPFHFNDRNVNRFFFQNFGKLGSDTDAHLDNAFLFIPEPHSALLCLGGWLGLRLLGRRKLARPRTGPVVK